MTAAGQAGIDWRLAPARSHGAPYLAALEAHAAAGPARFHVPGHKGGPGAPPELERALGDALALDFPSCIHGLDLGPGEAPLAAAERLAARAFGAGRTFFMVNGATEANHALCLALALDGGRVAVQRNVHASTMHGLVLSGLHPVFVAPEIDPVLGIAHCVTPERLAATLDETPGIAAAFIVSPTYYGTAADVRGLARVCAERGVALIVDEAWGPHFRFHDALPEDALSAGADAVVSGTHKLLGSLTQSAMLHLGHRPHPRLPEAHIASALALVRTTSPSSLLLASLDAARDHAEQHAAETLGEALETAAALRDGIRAIPGLDVVDARQVGRHGVAAMDALRVTVDVTGIGFDGIEVADHLLRDADVHIELATHTVVIAHLGAAEREGPDTARFLAALAAIALDAPPPGSRATLPDAHFGVPAIAPRTAYFSRHERVPLAAAAGRVSADTIAVYPPGIANVVPGERLTQPLVDYLLDMAASGLPLRGTWDASDQTVRVVHDPPSESPA